MAKVLTGESGSPRIRDALIAQLKGFPEVAEVRFLRPEFIGPKRLFVIARVDLVGDSAKSAVAWTRYSRFPNLTTRVNTRREYS